MSSPISNIFYIEALIDGLVGIACLFNTDKIPIANMSVSTMAAVKFFGASQMVMGLQSSLCASLPDVLPCKRALGIALFANHGIMAHLLYTLRNETFLLYTFGENMPSIESLLSVFHGLFLVAYLVWWQISLTQMKAVKKQQAQPQKRH